MRVLVLVAQILTALGITPLVIRALGPEGYGTWSLIGDVLWYYSLLDLGLSPAVTRFVATAIGADDNDSAQRYASATWALLTLGSAVIALSAVMASVYLLASPGSWTDALPWTILFLGTGAAITFPARTFIGVLNAKLRFDLAAITSLTRSLLSAVGTVLAVFLLDSPMPGIAAGLCGAQVVEYLLLRHWVRTVAWDFRPVLGRARVAEAKQLLAYSWVALVAQLADALRYRTGALLLAWFAGPAPVGIFSVGLRLVEYAVQILTTALGVLTPHFAALASGRSRKVLQSGIFSSLRISSALSVLLVGTISVAGYDFIITWAGRDYHGSYTVVSILAVPVGVAMAQAPLVSALYALGRHRPYMTLSLCEAALNIATAFWLIPRYGYNGAALSVALPMFVSKAIVQPVVAGRVLNLPLQRIYLTILRAGAWTAAPIVCVALFRARIQSMVILPIVSSMVLASLCSLFGALAVYVGILTTDERAQLRAAARPAVPRAAP